MDLLGFIKSIKKTQDLLIYDEASTKQAVVLPILSKLNWDIFNRNEVYPEYSTEAKRVDYSLRLMNTNKVFIEVKRTSIDLESHSRQLLNYSFQEGVSLAILTNGITWWFYLPLNEYNWEKRKFLTIELFEQESEEICTRFNEFLCKENVISGQSMESAIKVFKSKERISRIQETFPKALNKIINEPDELFIELISDATEKLCGYKPMQEAVINYILNNIAPKFAPSPPKLVIQPIRTPKPQITLSSPVKERDGERYILKYKNISAIGIKVGNGIRILKGSTATINVFESLKPHYYKLRNELIQKNILVQEEDHLTFNSDYKFEAFSAAASIICGSSRNGLKEFNKA
jgi:hypothetical protein